MSQHSYDFDAIDPGWCPACGNPRAVCEGSGTCPLGIEARRVTEEDGATDERWNHLIYEFGQFINRLQHKGSIGIMKYCDTILPLRDRLESGERTEQLMEQVMGIMQEIDPQ